MVIFNLMCVPLLLHPKKEGTCVVQCNCQARGSSGLFISCRCAKPSSIYLPYSRDVPMYNCTLLSVLTPNSTVLSKLKKILRLKHFVVSIKTLLTYYFILYNIAMSLYSITYVKSPINFMCSWLLY